MRNILPATISDRLEAGEVVIADANTQVSVLFADLVGFTPLAANKTAEDLVEVLNRIFSKFDDLALQFGVEKIKTIGDAYMAAAGVPLPAPDHATRVARFALAMVKSIQEFEQQGYALSIRIGIHSGPLIAGVIGKSKFAYDLWGDTVNTAARMESHSQPGFIQVSEASYNLLAAKFILQPRGSVDIKGKGSMATWYLIAEQTSNPYA